MWVRSVIKSNGDGGSWEFGLFTINDMVRFIPAHRFVIQGIQGWTDLGIGCPDEGCQVVVIPAGWAFGWASGDRTVLVVHPDKQDITISCDPESGCPTPFPKRTGSIVLTATANRDEKAAHA